MKKRFRSDVEKNLFRVPLSLDKKTDNWLHNLGISMKLTGGYKLPKSYIIRSLINAFIRLNVNFKNIKSKVELERRIFKKMNRTTQDLTNEKSE